MTYEQVETFLNVVNAGSINAAAEQMYLSQSTVSTRIQLLEEELGAALLIRQRGHRNLALTSYGKAFLPLANQWLALWQETMGLKSLPDTKSLRIASVDAVNGFTLVPLYKRHLLEHPNVRLSIETHHSKEIHSLVANHAVDMGFVFSQAQYPGLVIKPIYRELMYLVCNQDNPYTQDFPAEQLDPDLEVALNWGADYQQWHDRTFGTNCPNLIRVDTGSMLQHYLTEPGRWAVAPMSVVQQFRHLSNIVYYRLKNGPEPRICYQLTHRYTLPRHKEAIDIFERELQQYIIDSRAICKFEPWMLENQASS